ARSRRPSRRPGPLPPSRIPAALRPAAPHPLPRAPQSRSRLVTVLPHGDEDAPFHSPDPVRQRPEKGERRGSTGVSSPDAGGSSPGPGARTSPARRGPGARRAGPAPRGGTGPAQETSAITGTAGGSLGALKDLHQPPPLGRGG